MATAFRAALARAAAVKATQTKDSRFAALATHLNGETTMVKAHKVSKADDNGQSAAAAFGKKVIADAAKKGKVAAPAKAAPVAKVSKPVAKVAVKPAKEEKKAGKKAKKAELETIEVIYAWIDETKGTDKYQMQDEDGEFVEDNRETPLGVLYFQKSFFADMGEMPAKFKITIEAIEE